MTHTFCPHCGYDLSAAEPLKVGAFEMRSPGSEMIADGVPIRLIATERIIAYSLMSASPEPVARLALLERADIDSDSNVLTVLISRIKHRITAAGFEPPIKSVWGHGYAWIPAATQGEQ